MFGKIPWSSGLTKNTDIRLANASRLLSENNKKSWGLKTDEEKRLLLKD